jgi:LCP family protein required for cell wall assembly
LITDRFITKNTKKDHQLDEFQPIPLNRPSGRDGEGITKTHHNLQQLIKNKRKDHRRIWFFLIIAFAVYLFAPMRSNILVLGTDYLPPRDELSRTDTNILITINPLKPYIGMLSIPRDLWVNIPGIGENRINTAFFFAEIEQPGSGPVASMKTVHENFGVTINYFMVIKMEGVIKVIDTLGGVTINLTESMGGLPIGESALDGTQALAFARERYSADDFSRMKQGQILIKALLSKALSPVGWIRLPSVFFELIRSIKTNIPLWLFPRFGLAFLRAGPDRIDNRVITREMVNPFTTMDGAQVLAPNWHEINPVLKEMFGE